MKPTSNKKSAAGQVDATIEAWMDFCAVLSPVVQRIRKDLQYPVGSKGPRGIRN